MGTVTGPGVQGLDDITVDFPTVDNVGMRVHQVERYNPYAPSPSPTLLLSSSSLPCKVGAGTVEAAPAA